VWGGVGWGGVGRFYESWGAHLAWWGWVGGLEGSNQLALVSPSLLSTQPSLQLSSFIVHAARPIRSLWPHSHRGNDLRVSGWLFLLGLTSIGPTELGLLVFNSCCQFWEASAFALAPAVAASSHRPCHHCFNPPKPFNPHPPTLPSTPQPLNPQPPTPTPTPPPPPQSPHVCYSPRGSL